MTVAAPQVEVQNYGFDIIMDFLKGAAPLFQVSAFKYGTTILQ